MSKYKVLEDLIKINTIKDKQNKEIIDYIEKYLANLNFRTEYKGKYLIMSIGNEFKLGFLGHTDTVEFTEGWNTNPLELTQIDNKLYGLGTCDMKGGIAAMLDAISKIDFTKLKYGMKLYFTYDEEIGFTGICDIVKTNEKFPNMMIFGEPTNNEILLGNKGLVEYELKFNGIKAHSSNPERGKSANMNAVKFLSELEEFYNKEIKDYREETYEVPYTTMNVGVIKGGSAINSVAASCEIAMDFRVAKKEHIDIIKTKIGELARKHDCDVNNIQSIPPFINKSEFTDKIKTANFITEASFIESKCRIILGTGPVTAHEVNEHITEESYNRLVEQYKEIITKVCE